LSNAELCSPQDACRFYTDAYLKVHSKPRLIPLLYHTRGETLKNILMYIFDYLTTKHIAVYPEYISFRYITLMLLHKVSDSFTPLGAKL
jgi:hypothetical protein